MIFSEMRFEIPFFGHENIRSLHTNTIEITRDSSLTTSGDCIVGTNAFSGCSTIPNELKQKLCNSNTDVIISIIVKNYQFKIIGKGHESMVLTHPHDIVIRKSDFVCVYSAFIYSLHQLPTEMALKIHH